MRSGNIADLLYSQCFYTISPIPELFQFCVSLNHAAGLNKVSRTYFIARLTVSGQSLSKICQFYRSKNLCVYLFYNFCDFIFVRKLTPRIEMWIFIEKVTFQYVALCLVLNISAPNNFCLNWFLYVFQHFFFVYFYNFRGKLLL